MLMKSLSVKSLFATSLLAAAVCTPGLARAEGAPTYTGEVAGILLKHCQDCHRPGESVPLTLMSYKDVRPWAKSIKKVLTEGTMPPWHADSSVGEWKNERRLTPEEIGTVVRWVDAGAPMGDPLDLPPAKKYSAGWKIGEPDATFTFSREQVLSDTLLDEYRYVAMPTNFREDRWLKAVECRPGNYEAVHHIIAFTASADAIASAGGGGLGGLTEGVSLLGGYAPGMNPFIFQDGVGILIPKGAVIIFQMHYHKEPGAGTRATDRSSIGMKFADYPIKQQYRADAVFNPLIAIPPNAENHTINAMKAVTVDMELRTVLPHMHLRGKTMKVWVKFPDGTQKDIIWVPKYDFNWQTIYELKEPMMIPAGSKMYATATYDNSTNNPWNPDPNSTIRFGEDTNSEMMFAFLSYTVPGENLNTKDPEFILIGSGSE